MISDRAKKWKVATTFIITFSTLVGVAQGQQNMGEFYLEETQYQKARDFLLKQNQSNPNDVNTLNLLGDAYLGLNKQDSAKIMYQKAFVLGPKNAFVLVNLGKIALLEGNREAELDYFDKAKKAEKKNPALYHKIAEACFELSNKDTLTGKTYLTLGTELNSKYPGFHIVRGDWEAFNRAYGKAANAYENALFFNPNNAIAERKLGEIYAAARFYPQARDAYNKSILMKPDQILVYKHLGDLYYSLGRYNEAQKNYEIYLSKADENPDDQEKYAFILFFSKKYDQSAKVLEDLIKQNKGTNQAVFLRLRGYTAYETGEYKNGLEYMNKFFQIQDPKKIIASDHLYCGKLQEAYKMNTQAMESYNKSLAMDSTKTDIYENLVNLASRSELHPQAIQYYYKMIQHGFNKPAIYFKIGLEAVYEGQLYKNRFDSMRLQQTGKFNLNDSTSIRDSMRTWFIKADSSFAMVTRLDPNYYKGHLYKGKMDNYLDLNVEKDDARNSYEKALALIEKDPLKYKGSIIESYKYLGYYYYIKAKQSEGRDKAQQEQLKNTSRDFWSKILAIDPNDALALQMFEEMKQAEIKASKTAVKPKK
jgi:tetratricopeptide (TPR) repeat protein